MRRATIFQHANGRRRGFTLAESLTASVVLAASVTALSGALSASYQQSRVHGESAIALDLARELMEEIAGKPMSVTSGSDQPGWSAGQHDRTKYDTVDDYDSYTDSSSSIPTAGGSTIDAGNGEVYTRTVSVQASALPAGLTGTASDFSLVTVTVVMPHGQSAAISQLMTRATMVR